MYTTLPFIVCLFWLVFLLIEWKQSSHANHYLTLFAAVCMILYLCHALFFNSHSETSGCVNVIYSFCNIAVFPIYYIYIRRLTAAGSIKPWLWSLLTPALIIAIWAMINYLAYPNDSAKSAMQTSVARIVFLIQLVMITYFSWRSIREFNHRIQEFYSDADGRSANMTTPMLLILSACALISAAFCYIGREYFYENRVTLYIPSIIFSICLYFVFYVGYRQRFTADDLAIEGQKTREPVCISESIENSTQLDENPQPKVAVNEQSDDQPTENLSTEYDNVCRLIEDNQWYLKPDLRLPNLALLVGIGRTRLSILINENSGMSFSDFINRYRIERACNMLKEGSAEKDVVLSAIGTQCGFMSDSSFYRSFKKFTGVTPAQYRDKVNHADNSTS